MTIPVRPERFLSLYELYQQIVPVKGAIVELGVGSGSHLEAFLILRRLLEPWHPRPIVGFDTFGGGIPAISEEDVPPADVVLEGGASVGALDYGDVRPTLEAEAKRLSDVYDLPTSFHHEKPTFELIRGDIASTLPAYVARRPALVVALLSLDADVYTPTQAGLQWLRPLMPKGAVIVFDELGAMRWPGETRAVCDTLGINHLRLERFPWERDQCFAVLE